MNDFLRIKIKACLRYALKKKNHYSRILKVVAVILLQKKIRDYLGTFPKRGGGSPIPKTLSKFTNIVLEMFLKNDFFLKNKNAP